MRSVLRSFLCPLCTAATTIQILLRLRPVTLFASTRRVFRICICWVCIYTWNPKQKTTSLYTSNVPTDLGVVGQVASLRGGRWTKSEKAFSGEICRHSQTYNTSSYLHLRSCIDTWERTHRQSTSQCMPGENYELGRHFSRRSECKCRIFCDSEWPRNA